MILSLSIKNFILIEQIEIEFHQSLNVITGITGGGKSLVLKALDFLLGARASADIVLPGGDAAEVSAVFSADSRIRTALAASLGIALGEEDNLILRRVYRRDKNNLCYLNSTPVLVSDLSNLGEMLVDYLAQNHQLQLQKPAEQMVILDDFAKAGKARAAYVDAYAAFRSAQDLLRASEEERAELSATIEELKHDRGDLDALDPEPGEDTALKSRIAVYENLATIAAAFQQGIDNLYEGERSAYDALHSIKRAVGNVDDLPDELVRVAEMTDEVGERISDLVSELRSFLDDADIGPDSLADMERRYYAIQDTKHRLNMDLDQVIAYRAGLTARIDELETTLGRSDELRARSDDCWERVAAAGKALHAKRAAACGKFAAKLTAELRTLGMADAVFGVELDSGEVSPASATATGFDRVDFRFSANPGMEPRSLKDVASGGELSRIMLAIQCIIAGDGYAPLLVFDEIDSEIGGRLGVAIGEKMRRISRRRQVVCITHLPQIASYADRHLKIEKATGDDRTAIRLLPLEPEARVAELAHMLSGESEADASTVAEVKRMLEKAQNE